MKKFDFCIGNPPYNDEFGSTGENETYAPPVYNVFMDAAYSVSDKVELIHPARFLFDAGSTPKAWNQKMLRDKSFKVLHYEAESKEIFPNTKIRGGVCVSYRDRSKDYGAIGVFTPNVLLSSVFSKVREKNFAPISDYMYLQNRFNLEALYFDYPEYKAIIGSEGKDRRFETAIFEKIPLFSETRSEDDVAVYGVIHKKRLFRWFPKKYTANFAQTV